MPPPPPPPLNETLIGIGRAQTTCTVPPGIRVEHLWTLDL